MFSNLSIQTKFILAPILLIAIVSVFLYTYYPYQQKQLALQSIDSRIVSISNMFSIGVGIGMGETDFVAVSEALSWANTDSSVVFISVIDNKDLSIASFNPENIVVPEIIQGKENFDHFFEQDKIIFYKTKIIYQHQPFGILVIGYSLKKLDNDIAHLKSATLYFCLVLFAMGVILSTVAAHMISRNITKLYEVVKAISRGNGTVRAELTTGDEIGKLGKAFNHMLNRQEISRKELIAYSEQLKRRNEELNQFSYVVSHDLKAPLRAIFKLSEWIEEDMGNLLPVESKMHMKTLRGRVFRLEALINGLLEYSKIGRQDILPEETDTRILLNEVLELLNPPPHFKISIGPDMPVFRTSKLLLQQVFCNLISNGIKYNDKPEATIEIQVKDKACSYQFTVSDNGMGIERIYHEKIFVIFQTLEARDKVEGTGIGLSIVKKSIEDMGGSISLESETGKGSTFSFTWPKDNIINKKQYIKKRILV